MGGAVAMLVAKEVVLRIGRWWDPACRRTEVQDVREDQLEGRTAGVNRVVVYTYGAPAVGDAVLSEQYSLLVPETLRVTRANDAVPFVSRAGGVFVLMGHRCS